MQKRDHETNNHKHNYNLIMNVLQISLTISNNNTERFSSLVQKLRLLYATQENNLEYYSLEYSYDWHKPACTIKGANKPHK